MDQSPAASSPNVGTSTGAPLNPYVIFTIQDGVEVRISRRALEERTSPSSSSSSSSTNRRYGQLWIFDSGWGGVQMVVELAKQGIAAIVHIKNNFAGYPVTELGDKLRNCPGGSHLRCVFFFYTHYD